VIGDENNQGQEGTECDGGVKLFEDLAHGSLLKVGNLNDLGGTSP
jgi:hypothetical protein